MKYKTVNIIGLVIMTLSVIIQAIGLIQATEQVCQIGQLTFLIGIIIIDIAAQNRLRKYQNKYGNMEDE